MWRKRINVVVIVLTSLLVAGVAFPLIQQAREAARKDQSRYNLKQIGLALYNYHDAHQCFPPGGIFNSEGRGYHGWMTSIIPFEDSSPLYNSINMNEPWDSTKNAGTFLTKISVYENPSQSLTPRSKQKFPLAHYSANAHVMAVNSGAKRNSIVNGTNLFLAGELGGDFVPWGCPYNWRELGVLNSKPPTYGRSTRDGCQFLYFDGRVEFVANEVSSDILQSMNGEDLTGFKANALRIQRPAEFPCPADAVPFTW